MTVREKILNMQPGDPIYHRSTMEQYMVIRIIPKEEKIIITDLPLYSVTQFKSISFSEFGKHWEMEKDPSPISTIFRDGYIHQKDRVISHIHNTLLSSEELAKILKSYDVKNVNSWIESFEFFPFSLNDWIEILLDYEFGHLQKYKLELSVEIEWIVADINNGYIPYIFYDSLASSICPISDILTNIEHGTVCGLYEKKTGKYIGEEEMRKYAEVIHGNFLTLNHLLSLGVSSEKIKKLLHDENFIKYRYIKRIVT